MFSERCFAPAAALVMLVTGASGIMHAQPSCKDLPDHDALQAALIKATSDESSGLNLHMWGTIWTATAWSAPLHFRKRSRFAVARQPSDLRSESEHRERIQPGCFFVARWFGSRIRTRALDRESVFSRPAWRQPLRPPGEQPGRYVGRV